MSNTADTPDTLHHITASALQPGARVDTPDGPGYVYALDGDYTAVVLDKYAGRSNAPVYWVKPAELTAPAAAPHTAAPCSHDLTGDDLQGMTISGDSAPCPRCGAEVIRW